MSNGQGGPSWWTRIWLFGLPRRLWNRVWGALNHHGTQNGAIITLVINLILAIVNTVLLIIVFGDFWQQKVSGDRVWSAQQISAIYDMEWIKDSTGKERYRPKANARVREDAVKAYLSLAGHDGEARLSSADLINMSLRDMNLSKTDFQRSQFINADMTKSDLRDSTLVTADLRGANLSGADLSRADMTGAIAQGSKLSRAILQKAILERATLGVCDEVVQKDVASGEEFVRALPKSANCWEADFTGAELRQAQVCGVDFSHAIGLTQRQIDRARGDETTKLPPKLSIPRWWRKPSNKKNRTAAHGARRAQ